MNPAAMIDTRRRDAARIQDARAVCLALATALATLALLATAGCDQPAACGPDGECPNPLTCVSGFCRNTLGVAVGGDDASTADASCPSASPPGARAFAASAAFEGGLAIVGGEPIADDCHSDVQPAQGRCARIAACGGFAELPPLPALTDGTTGVVGAMAARHPGDGSLWVVGGRSGAEGAQPSGAVRKLPPGGAAWTTATAAVSGRSHGVLIATSSPKALWLFGGDIGQGGIPIATGELRRMLMPATSWQLAAAGGQLPGARRNMAGASLGDRFAIFGGADAGDDVHGDVHVLHAASTTWTRIATLGVGPGPRTDAALLASGNDQLLVFGGDEPDWGPRNDLWRLDLASGAWTRLRPGDLAADGRTDGPLGPIADACAPPTALLQPSTQDPEARAGGAWVRIDGGDLLLYGGRGRCGALDDLWRLDVAAPSWSRLRAGGGGICPLRAESCAQLCSGAGS